MTLAKHLYELANVMDQIEENNGEITEEILPRISQTELNVAHKVDAYVYFADVIKAQMERTKKNIENFKKTLQTLENLESRLKNNVKHAMQNLNLLSINGIERCIKLLNAGGSEPTFKPDDMFYQIECVNPKYILEFDDYVEEQIVYVIKDKDIFKEAIKANKFHSCYLLPRSKYVKFV